jgi:hypothetical protein
MTEAQALRAVEYWTARLRALDERFGDMMSRTCPVARLEYADRLRLVHFERQRALDRLQDIQRKARAEAERKRRAKPVYVAYTKPKRFVTKSYTPPRDELHFRTADEYWRWVRSFTQRRG